MTDTRIAETIREQIGHQAMYMMGAKNLVAHEKGLSFRVRGSKAINYIKITLTSLDLYDIEMGKIWGNSYKVVKTLDGAYNDMLHAFIERHTGLRLSLTRTYA